MKVYTLFFTTVQILLYFTNVMLSFSLFEHYSIEKRLNTVTAAENGVFRVLIVIIK